MKKQFNYQEFLNGAKVVTRNGIEVTDIHYFKNVVNGSPICAEVNGYYFTYHENGFYYDNETESDNDLFIVEDYGYTFIYRAEDGRVLVCSSTFKTEAEAQKIADLVYSKEFIKIVKL
jgi:hypothetical protein